MGGIINPTVIFIPMLVIVALTFVAFIRMAMMRGEAVKGGHDPAYYRAQIGKPEPEATVVAVRHYGNLFELPTLFYAGCITAFAVGGVSRWTLLFAWAYVLARLAQSAIHLSYNNPMHRGIAFMLGVVMMLLLWLNIASSVLAMV